MASQFRAAASARSTPPRSVSSILQKKPSGISSVRSNPKGAPPAGYLTKKFNRGALGIQSIRGRFNKAAGGGDDDPPGGGGGPAPAYKPKGPKF